MQDLGSRHYRCRRRFVGPHARNNNDNQPFCRRASRNKHQGLLFLPYNYLGSYNFQGQRVLDVGAASGLLTFFVEKEGATVVSYDLSEHHSWDVVPYAGADQTKIDTTRREHMRRINNAYWFCHRLLDSRAKASYGSVYDIPETIGPVDVSIYGSILLHLRDPFFALSSAAKLTKSAMIIADVCPFGRFGQFLNNPRFIPNPSRRSPWDTWWNLPPLLIQKYLAILGFPHSDVTWHRQLYQGKQRTLYTVVGRRVNSNIPMLKTAHSV
jgi:SAM-dependent methyltransferase